MGDELNEARINNTESRLNNIELRFNIMDTHLNNLDSRLSNVENRLTTVPAQDVISQLRQQLDRIEHGGISSFFYAALVFSTTAMIFAYNLLTTPNPTNISGISGIIIAALGGFLLFWSSWKFLRSLFRR